VHLFAQFGDFMQSVGHQQVLGQRLGKIALRPKERALEARGQLWNGMPIIDVARGQAKGQQFALIIDAPGAAARLGTPFIVRYSCAELQSSELAHLEQTALDRCRRYRDSPYEIERLS
jgi:hypothetical protein